MRFDWCNVNCTYRNGVDFGVIVALAMTMQEECSFAHAILVIHYQKQKKISQFLRKKNKEINK